MTCTLEEEQIIEKGTSAVKTKDITRKHETKIYPLKKKQKTRLA